jgi:uncharacterized membrane protein YqjE
MDSHVTENESIGGLIRGILRDFRTLVDEEVALARLELQEQVGRVRTAAVSLSIAAVALLLGAAFILVALATAIADLLGWPVWSGFLIVAVVMTIIGVITLMLGRTRLRAVNMVPDKTIESVKENAEWISKRLSSARR